MYPFLPSRVDEHYPAEALECCTVALCALRSLIAGANDDAFNDRARAGLGILFDPIIGVLDEITPKVRGLTLKARQTDAAEYASKLRVQGLDAKVETRDGRVVVVVHHPTSEEILARARKKGRKR